VNKTGKRKKKTAASAQKESQNFANGIGFQQKKAIICNTYIMDNNPLFQSSYREHGDDDSHEMESLDLSKKKRQIVRQRARQRYRVVSRLAATFID